MNVKSFKGEFISHHWQYGLNEEKERVANKHGLGAYICMIENYNYCGEVRSNSLDKYLANRYSELQYNAPIGEVVKVGSPEGYIKLFTKLEESKKMPSQFGYDLLAKTILGKTYNGVNSLIPIPKENRIDNLRYSLVQIKAESVNYVTASNSLVDLKHLVYPYLTKMNKAESFYIVDYQTSKRYRCFIGQEKVKHTTSKTNEYQTIIPLYKFIYYGCV